MPLMAIIVLLAIAGVMIMVGAALTVRRYFDAQPDHTWVRGGVQNMTTAQCSYCGGMTVQYIGVMHDGYNYNPVCIDCQYRTGIRCPDGTINRDFIYQVQQYA